MKGHKQKGDTFAFQAADQEELDRWFGALHQAGSLAAQPQEIGAWNADRAQLLTAARDALNGLFQELEGVVELSKEALNRPQTAWAMVHYWSSHDLMCRSIYSALSDVRRKRRSPGHRRQLLTAHCSLLTAHCSLLAAHCSLLTAHCSLLTAHCSLLTACYADSMERFFFGRPTRRPSPSPPTPRSTVTRWPTCAQRSSLSL